MRVKEAVIISLPERVDRLVSCLKGLPGDWPFPTPRHHPGVREAAPPWFTSGDGAWGCRQAHLQVLQSAWERNVATTLIMEDDAIVADHFTAQWQLIRDRIPVRASMLMLGGQHVRPPIPAGVHLVRCVNTRRTHAYVIKLSAIPLLMRTFTASRSHIDHALFDFQSATFTYAPSLFLIGQDSGWSDISEKNNDKRRFWV